MRLIHKVHQVKKVVSKQLFKKTETEMKIILRNRITIILSTLRYKWKNLPWLVVISTEVRKSNQTKFIKKTRVAAYNPGKFKKDKRIILIHISRIISSTISTIQASRQPCCMDREILELHRMHLEIWILLISNLGLVQRMFKGRRIVNHLKILIVFITTTILTAQEMVIVTTDKAVWVVNKQKLLFLDRIVLLEHIMTNIT